MNHLQVGTFTKTNPTSLPRIDCVMVQKLSADNYEDFVRQKRAAAVHFDADWDIDYRPITRRRMNDAAQALGEDVNFAEVDCDREAELARSLLVLNVPTVVYYIDGYLAGVLIGARQNILERLKRLLRGEQIGRGDGLGYEISIPNF